MSRLRNPGNVNRALGNLPQATKYLHEALAIFEDIGMPREAEIARSNIAELREATAVQED